MDLGKLTQKQMIYLMVFYITATLLITFPRLLSDTAQHGGWLCIILAMLLFTGYGFFLSQVILMMKDRDFVTFIDELFGRWIGPAVTMIGFLLPTLLYSAYVVRLVSELFITLIIPETPIEILVAMILILRYWMMGGGIRGIGIFVELVLPGVMVILLLMLLMSIQQTDFSRIMPFFDTDAPGIIRGTMAVLSAYLEIGVLLYAANRLRDPKRTQISLLWVNICVGLIFLAVYWLCLGSFGTAYTKRMAFPTIDMIRNISIGNFFEHIESVFLSIWVLMSLTKGSMSMYACCVGFQSWFKLPSYQPLLMPISVIIFYLALLPQDLLQAVFRFEQFKAYTYPIYGFVIILLLYGLARFRKINGGKTG